ncbi:MAG: AIR synthase-related protein, partial [Chloroflexota bacterium]|nr:AIR synthase-related protein [Chloroflexota bacterium]
IVGGDIVGCDTMVVTVTVIGRALVDEADQPLLMTRSGAQAGDAIAVTGDLGDSAGGLRLLLEEKQCSPEAAAYLKRAHLRHRPPLAVGQTAARQGVRAAIDISDGLLQDLGHVCQASGVGAVVWADRVPIGEALAQTFPQDALALACGGGEDYQLLLAASPEIIERVQKQADVPLTFIGEMVADRQRRVRLLDESGRQVMLARAGWDHLRPGGRPYGRGAPWRR